MTDLAADFWGYLTRLPAPVRTRRRGGENFPWHPEHVEALKTLMEGGHSAAEAAAELNKRFDCFLTRNAVMGRAYRLGLGFRSTSPFNTTLRERCPPELRKPRKRKAFANLTIRERGQSLPPIAVEPPPISDLEIPMEQRRQLVELTDSTCRWPVGESDTLFFCGGAPAKGMPYCAGHCRRAYPNWSPVEASPT